MEYKRIKLTNLHPNPYHFHEALAGSLVARIKAFKKILHEVETAPLQETLDAFLHDMHPEREVAVWEWIAEEYQKKTMGKPRSFSEKMRIYTNLLNASGEKFPLIVAPEAPKRRILAPTTGYEAT